MIFQHTWQAVLDGSKTQTRRLVKEDEYQAGHMYGLYEPHTIAKLPNARIKYQVGRTYAVQPGRGKRGIARIRLTGIRREDVRSITHEDAVAEGFGGIGGFLETWTHMHDEPACNYIMDAIEHAGAVGLGTGYLMKEWRNDYLPDRPANRYDAWVLEFELVRGDS